MNVHVRMTRKLYDEIKADLSRPHEFASERIGFISAKLGGRDSQTKFVLLSSYHPVVDSHYIEDDYVGARINASAIREAMQWVLDTGDGCYHVHMHPHLGSPRLSFTDEKEIPPIVSSLRVVGKHASHGIIVLSRNNATGYVWLPNNSKSIIAETVSIIGYPTWVWRGSND